MCLVCLNQGQPLSAIDQNNLHAAFAMPGKPLPDGPTANEVIEVSEQLVSNYLEYDDRDFFRKFNVQTGETINVDITALTAEGRSLAVIALDAWTQVSGLKFNFVSGENGNALITFDDNEEGAFAGWSFGGNTQSSAHVNVSTAWVANYGTGVDSYSMQTYLHEIGHALGLAHAGNYTSPIDESALFAEDSWQLSVMSYFSQAENATIGASWAYAVTPMLADILAIQNLYGISGQIGLGDTTYGIGSNAGMVHGLIGELMADGRLQTPVAFTIIDRSGIDTLDFRTDPSDQIINLTPGSASNIYGLVENMMIEGTSRIEVVFAGLGADRVVGNATRNDLFGNGGADTLEGSKGRDRLSGEAGDDVLTGGEGADRLFGGEGNDRITSNSGSDVLAGDAGADTFVYAHKGDSRPDHADRITDFDRKSDRIDLSGLDANILRSKDQSFDFIGTRNFTEAGQLRISFGHDGARLLADTDGDGRADLVLVLNDVETISARHFLL